MLEKIALAIARRRMLEDQHKAEQGGCDIMLVADAYMPDALLDARAAVEAMRPLQSEHHELYSLGSGQAGSPESEPDDFNDGWVAVIDAILTEKE